MIELKSTSKQSNKNPSGKLIVETSFLGLLDYEKSVQLQKDLLLLAQQSRHHYVLGLEHPAVLTLGHRAVAELEVLSENKLPIVHISRGGLATIHAEGQLVIYPIVYLRDLNLGVRDYVMLLLQTTKDFLYSLGVDSFIDKKAIGLYTKDGKIAFCGIQIKNGISQHGLSLNVRNDLSLFTKIKSCGVVESKFDSLSQHNINHTLAELFQLWVGFFIRHLVRLSGLKT